MCGVTYKLKQDGDANILAGRERLADVINLHVHLC